MGSGILPAVEYCYLDNRIQIGLVGSAVDRKSTSGYCFSMGSAMISWSSRKKGSIAQSIAEAEYIAASDACKEAVWLRKLVSDLVREKTWLNDHPLR